MVNQNVTWQHGDKDTHKMSKEIVERAGSLFFLAVYAVYDEGFEEDGAVL